MEFHAFLESWGWVVAIAALVIGAAILHVIIRSAGHGLSRRLLRRIRAKRVIIAMAPKAMVLPAIALVWVLIVVFSLEIAFRQWVGFDHPIPLITIRKFAIVAAIGWWLMRWTRMAQRRLQRHTKNGELALELAQIDVAGKFITLVLIVFLAVLVMQVAGLDMKALATLGGFGAVAVGFAGKDVFSNLFSGLMIYITKPFAVGDLISSSDKGAEGTVEKIGWYITRLRMIDKRPAYVPNSLFSTAVVTNTSRITNRRIEFKLGLRYHDLPSVSAIAEEIRSMLQGMEALDQKLGATVWFTEYASSSVNIFVRAYTAGADWFAFLECQQEVLLRCADIVRNHNADFAFPTTTLDFPENFTSGANS